MENSKIKISQNFWAELEARGFLDRRETGGASRLNFSGTVKKTDDYDYRVCDPDGQALICFVSAPVFLKALKMTEEKVKYKLFL